MLVSRIKKSLPLVFGCFCASVVFAQEPAINGTVPGALAPGVATQLQINGGNNLAFTANGGFSFGDRLAGNAAYSVTVETQPSNPAQTCTVRNGSGTIGKTSVTNVLVSCTQTGRFAYVANRQSNTVSAYAIESGGVLAPLTGSPFAVDGTTPTALAVDPDGQFLYVANSGSNTLSVFSINVADGTLTALGLGTATGTGPGAVVIEILEPSL